MALQTMDWPAIEKPPARWKVVPNLVGYDAFCASFHWSEAARELETRASGGLNIAYQTVDRHADGARGNRVALRWLGRKGQRREITYSELKDETARFANALVTLGVAQQETVFVLLGRIPELYISTLGALKNRNVVCPLFAAFGPEPIQQRMEKGHAAVLVTTPALYRRKIAPIRSRLPELRHVILVGDGAEAEIPETVSCADIVSAASASFTIPTTDQEDPALLHFTSGTTGTPKGAVHVHGAVVAHYVTGKLALDFHDDDVFWCTADPGWVTGTSYGIVSPLANGLTVIVDEGDFDAVRWYGVLQNEAVTVWYTAPTAIRMLMKAGAAMAQQYDLHDLRFVGSVGEPLNPEGVVWGVEAFGLPIHDNWWQTETGGIMIANFAAMEVRPGSMGRPMPGIEAAIVRHEGRNVEVLSEPDCEGELALRPGWPSMFRGYLGEEQRYQACFENGWYLSGDLATRDKDGYFWFVGRADDVIKSAGHLIGPFEVESAILGHPAVAEAGVIGKPDPIAGAIVKAFVALKPGYEPTDELRLEILGFARQLLGAAVAPKEIEFADALPHTRSGKIMRRLLRARELGLPEGDLSTLEPNQ